ncbi:D-3-phosphoglycerate dehydrogenase [Alicyclobacillus hesperidum URH17-3-68]|uniref:D-3-phosphoglycerate dehydrogenase n=1 Tax=Alicyclobacillus hesperidum TaxID=89784 RepID=A0A1H2XG31_9BACL|nr:phosphoglycerate dehydrogenase [Alicyclobacillus hesperidum]KRW92471.1 D-3-phosphoglycerate dehydrogenase [Alicyclobacillus tengchongensis]EJY55746.1 D-3-phosphoglycerate dehydrogenase [Alicyclobacillus hesperidum URH17-3-68]SDW91795.1 D-3-phosphoglycerate dehydrogenase [Alicyclobacillus hesperidum]GLG01175.1 D-3-phosphoglycerate dehydrogenase [Alicyclobacillus hesperidum subsp. aegles]GLV13636.1 D-3-phosphoglycerate dehydrogenase [Alicyclobacillus hesperidum]
MTTKILVTDDISSAGIDVLSTLPDATVDVQTGLSPSELLVAIADADALVVRSQTTVTEQVIAAAKRLKVIGRAGVGVDNIDLEAATRRGILVINAPDGNTIAAAEHTFAMMISLARHIPAANRDLLAGNWNRKKWVGVELRGKTLAILGMGRIGTEVAKRAKVFGMTVLGYDPFLTEDRAQSLGVQKSDLDSAIRAADFITVHTPLTKETHHMIDAGKIAMMKEGVRIINCARGGIIDERALADALRLGKVAGAAIDVFESEPLALDHPLRQCENVILTPHLGASTVEAQENVAIQVAEEIVQVLRDDTFEHAVNLPSLSPRQKERLAPYLALAEQLGLFAAQLAQGAPSQMTVTYAGDAADPDGGYLTRTVLKGFFGFQYSGEVNYVNALRYAEDAGLRVQEVRESRGRVYTNEISISFATDAGSHRVSGTLYSESGPRIVELDGYPIDMPIEGILVYTRHEDKPGMIGRIGTLLGDAQINIAGMQVGRRETGGEAVMLLTVDKSVPNNVIDEIASHDGIRMVRAIEL